MEIRHSCTVLQIGCFFYKNKRIFSTPCKIPPERRNFALSKKFPLLDHTLAMAQALDIVIVNTIAIQL